MTKQERNDTIVRVFNRFFNVKAEESPFKRGERFLRWVGFSKQEARDTVTALAKKCIYGR